MALEGMAMYAWLGSTRLDSARLDPTRTATGPAALDVLCT
eukprot:gene7022-9603_t